MKVSYARNHLNLGFVYAYFKNYSSAIPCLKKAIELDQNYAKAYYYLGYSFLLSDNLADAKVNLLKSIELAVLYPEAYYNLGVVDYKQRNYADAVTHFTTALESSPGLQSNKEFFLMRGEAYKHIGEMEKSKSDLEQAKKLK
jgi:tetratricopeptide (TPR) repeat protein